MVIENNKVVDIKLCDDCVDNLRVAIVNQAIFDYRNPKFKENQESIERFFLSNWGQLLSGNLGDYIIKNIKGG